MNNNYYISLIYKLLDSNMQKRKEIKKEYDPSTIIYKIS